MTDAPVGWEVGMHTSVCLRAAQSLGPTPTLSIHLAQNSWLISGDIWLAMERNTGVLLTNVLHKTDMYAPNTPGWHFVAPGRE